MPPLTRKMPYLPEFLKKNKKVSWVTKARFLLTPHIGIFWFPHVLPRVRKLPQKSHRWSWPLRVEKKPNLEYLGVDKVRPKNKWPTPIGSMGLVYLPTWIPWKSTIHVGKYTIHGSYGTNLSWMNFIFQDGFRKNLGCSFFGEAVVGSTWIYSSKMRSVKLSSLMVSHKNYVLRVVNFFKQWEASWKIIGTSWFQSTNSRNCL